MGETWHRGVLLFISAASVACLSLGIKGADTYIESNRSVLKDATTSTGYVWKKESCRDLFRAVATSPDSSPYFGAMKDLCETAKANDLPPASLGSIIDGQLAAHPPGNPSLTTDLDRVRTVVQEATNQLARNLPVLKAYFGPYQRRIAYMWLFIPGLAGALGAYFYARSLAPLLFASLMRRIEHTMYGKSKYGDRWAAFVRPKKRQ